MSKRASSKFVCQQCGSVSPSYLGRCPNCEAWNSFVETLETTSKEKAATTTVKSNVRALKLSDVAGAVLKRQTTGISELDLVLGGGVVPGMVTLLTGEPGIGKSTLLLDLAKHWPDKVLYVAGEESASQIKIRADRMKIKSDQILILEETNVDQIVAYIKELDDVSLVIVDSVQTLTSDELSGMAGTVGQVRECTARLISTVKPRGIPLFLVGHVTKEGTIAGPKVLEHAVDATILLEGEKFTSLRLIRSQKNRFGPTDEVGVLEMQETGLIPVSDIASLFLDSKKDSGPGACLTVTMEGSRPLLVEVQALVTSTPLPNPRRVGAGVNYNRLLTIIAILQKRLNLPLYKEDIYVNVAGGLQITEPAIDLAVAMAIISSYKNKPVPKNTAAVGELDLLGNIRRVQNLEKRLKEARKLGISTLISAQTTDSISQITL